MLAVAGMAFLCPFLAFIIRLPDALILPAGIAWGWWVMGPVFEKMLHWVSGEEEKKGK